MSPDLSAVRSIWVKFHIANLSFYTCLAGLYKNGQLVEHPDCKPWVEDSFWEIKRSNNAIVEEAYKQFNGKISDMCDSSTLQHFYVS